MIKAPNTRIDLNSMRDSEIDGSRMKKQPDQDGYSSTKKGLPEGKPLKQNTYE